jgi:hypothetical protein
VPDRDLVALAANEQFWPPLLAGMDNELTSYKADETLAKFAAVPGLRTMLPHWFEMRAERVATASLVQLTRRLADLKHVQTAEAFAYSPTAARRIAATDVAEKLGSTLRGGLFDEVSWPALEEAVAQLVSGREPKPGSYDWDVKVVGEAWPALILRHKHTIVVVGPEGILLEHVLRIPPKLGQLGHRFYAAYVDDQLLVCWTDQKANWHGYWTGQPTKVFRPSGLSDHWYREYASIPSPGGGRFVGGGVLHAGDTRIPMREAVHSDGNARWHQVRRWVPEKYRAVFGSGKWPQARRTARSDRLTACTAGAPASNRTAAGWAKASTGPRSGRTTASMSPRARCACLVGMSRWPSRCATLLSCSMWTVRWSRRSARTATGKEWLGAPG